ncbi:MAG: hypothetical protein RR603_06870, partial [Kurthia sp.]
MTNSHGIVLAHVNGLAMEGITFKNNNNASFLHILGSKKVTLNKNKFIGATASTKKPAIILESTAKNAKNISMNWSALDGTPNDTIKMTNNLFENQFSAIETKFFERNKHQLSINMTNNTFSKIRNEAILMTYWKNAELSKNAFKQSARNKSSVIIAAGAVNPKIKMNTFIETSQLIIFRNINDSKGEIGTVLSASNKKDLATNAGKKLASYEVSVPASLSEEPVLDSISFMDLDEMNKDVYRFNEQTKPLNKTYLYRPSYTEKTATYYALRSIMEQLEEQGGGKLIIEEGLYTITNSLFVPSNVTIELENGATLLKGSETDAPTMPAANSIFQFVAPSKSAVAGAVGGYNGSQNIKLYSTGRATID